jgi:hypothetical protein
MPEIISCPSCQRKLQVPPEYFGQTVQCPECKHTFTAGPAASIQAAPLPPVPQPTPPAAAETGRVPEWDKPPEPPRRRDADDNEERQRRRRRFEDEDDAEDYADRPRRRRYVAPHRGGMILAFGILAILPTCMPIFGPLAWIMGSNDLAQIRAGTMDRDGEGLTQAGRILGIVTTMLILLGFGSFCLFFLLSAATARRF